MILARKGKIKFLLLGLFLFSLLFIFYPKAGAVSPIEISYNSLEHTVAIPYEKSFRFEIEISNNSKQNQQVFLKTFEEKQEPGLENWTVLAPDGYYNLSPGEEGSFVITFEAPSVELEPNKKIEPKVYPIELDWGSGKRRLTITVKAEVLPFKDLSNNLSQVNFSVVDDSTNQPIDNPFIQAWLPSGLEQKLSKNSRLNLPSGKYLEQIYKDYSIDQSQTGYFLQVSARGFKSHFEVNWLPEPGETNKEIRLQPLRKVGQYQLINTVESKYSIWSIRASQNNKYFAFSQGTHGQIGLEPVNKTKVLLANDQGKLIWQKEVAGECWGLDISADGKYIGAGCSRGDIYLWNRKGERLWQKENSQNIPVRWLKFSPDSDRLITGPIDDKAERAALFEVESGEKLWQIDIGGYLREARFSEDGRQVYLAASNGVLLSLNTDSGQKIFQTGGGYYLPFFLGISQQEDLVVAAGKGRVFSGFRSQSGEQIFQTVVDQTVTAGGLAADGSLVGATVGGLSYMLAADGKISWSRYYGGVGHNGVFYSVNGKYVLFGGPNPTLFDREGNVLWQREKDKTVEMSGVAEIDTGGANNIWISGGGSLLVIGNDNGEIEFYQGEVRRADNNYSQIVGPTDRLKNDSQPTERLPGFGLWPIITAALAVLTSAGTIIWLIIKEKRKTTIDKWEDFK